MKVIRFLAAAVLAVLLQGPAEAGSGCAAIQTGAVLTAGQWNNCFSLKQDDLGYTPVNKAGDAMAGRLSTVASTTFRSGFSIFPGTAPSSPLDGDVWMTTVGVYARINGITVGPLVGSNSSAALSRVNDTNVTATLSGTPGTALLQPVTITFGWQSTLAIARGGTGAGTAAAALTNLMPTPTRAGDLGYWNGTIWTTLAGNNSGTRVLQEDASGLPSWVVAGSGTVTSAVIASGSGMSVSGTCTITTTGTCTIAQALTNTQFNVGATATSNVSSASAVMLGAGVTNCRMTPTYSGRIRAQFDMTVSNATGSGIGTTLSLRVGSGAGPAFGSAATGSVISGPFTMTSDAGATRPMTLSAIVTGLTPGTTYWFDVGLSSNGSVALSPTYGCNGQEY